MLTVLIAKTGGPEFGGIFAAFPAMFISTLTISYKAHGIEFSRAMVKSLMVQDDHSGSVCHCPEVFIYIDGSLYRNVAFGLHLSSQRLPYFPPYFA